MSVCAAGTLYVLVYLEYHVVPPQYNACLPSVYLLMGALFLLWPGSGNLAGAVEGGRSAGTKERSVSRRWSGR